MRVFEHVFFFGNAGWFPSPETNAMAALNSTTAQEIVQAASQHEWPLVDEDKLAPFATLANPQLISLRLISRIDQA